MNLNKVTNLFRLSMVALILIALVAIATPAQAASPVTVTVTSEYFVIRSAPVFNDKNVVEIKKKSDTFDVVACMWSIWGSYQEGWCLINADGPLAFNENDRWVYVSARYLSFDINELRTLPRLTQSPVGERMLETLTLAEFGASAAGPIELWGGAKVVSNWEKTWISWFDTPQFQDVLALPKFNKDEVSVTNATGEECVFTDGNLDVTTKLEFHQLSGGATYNVPVGSSHIVVKSGHCAVTYSGTKVNVEVVRRAFKTVYQNMGWAIGIIGFMLILAVIVYLNRKRAAQVAKAFVRILPVIVVIAMIAMPIAAYAATPTPPPPPGVRTTNTPTATKTATKAPTALPTSTPVPTLAPTSTPVPTSTLVPTLEPMNTLVPTLEPTATAVMPPAPRQQPFLDWIDLILISGTCILLLVAVGGMIYLIVTRRGRKPKVSLKKVEPASPAPPPAVKDDEENPFS